MVKYEACVSRRLEFKFGCPFRATRRAGATFVPPVGRVRSRSRRGPGAGARSSLQCSTVWFHPFVLGMGRATFRPSRPHAHVWRACVLQSRACAGPHKGCPRGILNPRGAPSSHGLTAHFHRTSRPIVSVQDMKKQAEDQVKTPLRDAMMMKDLTGHDEQMAATMADTAAAGKVYRSGLASCTGRACTP